MRSVFTLSRLIWSSGEYLVLPRSPPVCGHSPFLAPIWPDTTIDVTMNAAASGNRATPVRINLLNIRTLPFVGFQSVLSRIGGDIIQGSRLKAQGSRLKAQGSRLTARGSRRAD